jgi:hypothetical protein
MADRGGDHAGFDCFVFPSQLLAEFAESRSCCGAGQVCEAYYLTWLGTRGDF